jgi:transcriptional regulator with XRE-family HTH domain
MMTIGEIIRINREQQQISQETLSFGICSVSNLSRIENGMQIPSRSTYEALMERLGQPPEVFPSFLSSREVEAFRLKHQVNQKLIVGDYEEAEILLDKLDSIPGLERIYEQFIQYVRAIFLLQSGTAPKKALNAMQRVAKLSIKEICPKKILRQVLTKDDLSILRILATAYYQANEQDKGIEILHAVKEYIERKVVDDDGISPMYTSVLYNLTNWIGLKGHHKEVIRLCEIGIQRCIDYGAYYSFAALLFNKGYALVMLGMNDEARKYIQEAYYINRARGKLKSCEINMNFAKEHGIVI